MTRFAVRGAVATFAGGINDRGQIVGKYSNTTGDMTAPSALIRPVSEPCSPTIHARFG